MSNIFVFDPAEFKELYPQFSKFTDKQLQWFFDQVENTVLDNTATSCIDVKTRRKLFYYLVAHVAELQGRIDSRNSSLIGRVSSATEGSVSINTDFPTSVGKLSSWLNQTPYGVSYLAMISPYLSALWFNGERPMPVNRSRWFRLFGW
ncbi:DUF4054 domain-containing protein [Chryseobacterium sp.]|uniref:DUF4054 domain-containing protein n=1 Tax=Chryseobacterium sp. TaxID=1871047 RepID=UPI00321BB57F